MNIIPIKKREENTEDPATLPILKLDTVDILSKKTTNRKKKDKMLKIVIEQETLILFN